MRTIGLIGGMSWESTAHYYRAINEEVRRRLGGLHSAQLLLHSVDFAPFARMQAEERWSDIGDALADIAARLEGAGADFIVVGANTMHKVAPAIEARVKIPLLHVTDAVGAAIRARGLTRVGLLGTRFTMEQAFYRDRLTERFELEVITPAAADRARLHDIIFHELCQGRIEDASREAYRGLITRLVADGAQAVILGCTELPMLLDQRDIAVPAFDTAALHAIAAVDRALAP